MCYYLWFFFNLREIKFFCVQRLYISCYSSPPMDTWTVFCIYNRCSINISNPSLKTCQQFLGKIIQKALRNTLDDIWTYFNKLHTKLFRVSTYLIKIFSTSHNTVAESLEGFKSRYYIFGFHSNYDSASESWHISLDYRSKFLNLCIHRKAKLWL